jgi:hypothetical protein
MGWSGWETYLTQSTTVLVGNNTSSDPIFTHMKGGISVNTPWEVDVPYFSEESGDDDTFHAYGIGFKDDGPYEATVTGLKVFADGEGDLSVEVEYKGITDSFNAGW